MAAPSMGLNDFRTCGLNLPVSIAQGDVFILLTQKHIVRGLTMGQAKGWYPRRLLPLSAGLSGE